MARDDQPDRLQHTERVADGPAADTEPFGERAFSRQGPARGEGAVENQHADAVGDLVRRLDHARANVEHADLHALVLRAVLQELDAIHVAVRVVEHELIDTLGVPEVRQHGLVTLREVRGQDVVTPRVAEAEVPADLRVDAVAHHLDAFANPLVVVLVVREQRQPRAQILDLQVLRAVLHELFHLLVEDGAERERELLGALVVRVLVEVDVPGEVRRAGADRDFDGHRSGGFLRDVVEIGPAQGVRSFVHGAVVDDAAPVVDERLEGARARADHGRVRVARRLEARDALVEIPAERPNDSDVIVVPHVAVGHDVESRVFLVADHRRDGVIVCLFVLNLLECDAYVAPAQLVLEPVGPGIRADHGRREDGVDDLLRHCSLLKIILRRDSRRPRGPQYT